MTPQDAGKLCEDVKAELAKVIIGQDEIVEQLLISLFCKGHCLLIGVPGLAKTLLVKSIAEIIDLQSNRIQFTPDLMPADILGSEIIRESAGQIQFEYQEGPIFTNLLLADEINRTPPKTQSALLEAMQERKVTIAGKTRDLSQPFLVVATQNPIEQEGTYPLPEAQLDRFMFSLNVDYPSLDEEKEIVRRTTMKSTCDLNKVLTTEQIIEIQDLIFDMPVSDHVLDYAVELAAASRPTSSHAPEATKEYIEWGAGPRASQYLVLGAKAQALFAGRVTPEASDVRKVAAAVLQHRIVTNYKATGKGLDAIAVSQLLIEQVKEASY